MKRLDQLLEFFRQEPNDPFIIYALALEFTKSNPEQAIHYFEGLLKNHPDYLATYYQAGKLFEQTNQPEKAIEIYQLGIEKSKQIKDFHTQRELQSALDSLFEDE